MLSLEKKWRLGEVRVVLPSPAEVGGRYARLGKDAGPNHDPNFSHREVGF